MDIVSLCYRPVLNSNPPILTAGLPSPRRLNEDVPRLVLLDANALLMPFQFRLNLEAELRRLLGDVDIAVPSPVLAELRLLADRDRNAQAGLRLAERYRTLEAPGSADDALLDLAQAHKAAVVTLDQPLLDRLRGLGLPRIFLRSRNHLAGEGL
jgi:rRNA-processing protein FCF1